MALDEIQNAEAESSVGATLDGASFQKILGLARAQVVLPKQRSSNPFLLCPVGLIGSGKTTVIKQLAEVFGLVRISNDEVRQLLMDDGYNLLRTREISITLAKEFIKQGYGIAFDADCAGPTARALIESASQKVGLPVILIHISAPEDVILERLRSRSDFFESREHAIENYLRRKPLHADLSSFDFTYTLDTSREDFSKQLEDAVAAIQQRLTIDKTPPNP